MDQISDDNNANDSCGDPIAEQKVTADQSDDQSVAEEETLETNSSKKPKSGKKVVKIGQNLFIVLRTNDTSIQISIQTPDSR